MKRFTLGLVFILALGLASCTPSQQPVEAPELEIVSQDQGWVQVKVTGVSSSGYELHWGDSSGAYGVSNVFPSHDLYEHFYQAVEGSQSGDQIPTEYDITLFDAGGHSIASESVLIERVDCHLSLVSVEGRRVSVRYWGRHGIDYSISWGDNTADHVTIDMQTATGLLSHIYDEAGSYTLGMEEIWAPSQPFFSVTIE